VGQLDVNGQLNNSSQALWPVQPGDYLEVKGSGLVQLIVCVIPPDPSMTPPQPATLVLAPVAPFQISGGGPNPNPNNTVYLANTNQIALGMSLTGAWVVPPGTTITVTGVNNTPPQSINLGNPLVPPQGNAMGFLPAYMPSPTPEYRIIRQPRVLTGETPLQLPAGICIDPGAKYNSDPFVLNQQDIMFSPQGGMLNSAGNDRFILWVRDYTKDVSYPVPDAALPSLNWPPAPPALPGDQFLVLIQTHTGFIAEHPVNTAPGNVTPQAGADPYWPYRFALDARSSGL